MKRGASYFTTIIIFAVCLALVMYLWNPSNGASLFNQVVTTNFYGNLWNQVLSFFGNPNNYAGIVVAVGLSFIGGGNFIASAGALIAYITGSAVVINPLINSLFSTTDPTTAAIAMVFQTVMQIGLFIASLIIFRGIIEI